MDKQYFKMVGYKLPIAGVKSRDYDRQFLRNISSVLKNSS